MYTNISNIIDALLEVIELNRGPIDALINEYEQGRTLNVFKGMRKTLPRDAFPSLELEPISGSNQWVATRLQSPSYTIQFTLTVVNDNDELSVEYAMTLSRLLLELFNNPANMALKIPLEISYLPNGGHTQTQIQDAFVDNVSYNAVKDGTIRIVQWDWYCKTIEGFMPEAYDNNPLKPTDYLPHPLPPV